MIQKIMCKCPWGILALRVVVGVVFLAHGITKLQNMEGTIGFFASIGMGAIIAYIVAIVETLAGAMLIVGFMTMFAGYAISVIMLVAIITVKGKMGFLGGYELDIVLLAAGLALAWSNTSYMSLDKMIKMKCNCGGKCLLCSSACDSCEGCQDKCTNHEVMK